MISMSEKAEQILALINELELQVCSGEKTSEEAAKQLDEILKSY